MKKFIKNNIISILLLAISIFSLFIGFILNEDLSTGGAQWDFNLTWPIIINYTDLNFSTDITRHMPLHYFLMSLLNGIFNDQNFIRILYLLLSFLFPFFLYLNLTKIYNYKKDILIIFSSSFLLIPLFRASAIWPNAHLTAIIFFLIGNYFYLKSKETNTFVYKIINLLFLSFAIYCIQTYLLLFLYYLYKYFSSEKLKNFIKLFLFSSLLSLPGFLFIILNPRIVGFGDIITRDLYYTLSSNFSLIFFFFIFLLLNKKNLSIVVNEIKNFKNFEIFIVILITFFVFYFQEFFALDPRLRGGGFFYKLSYLILNNNLIFIISALLGLIVSYILIKYDQNFFYAILIMNLMSLNFIVYQKYFEPLFLIMIAVLFKNFLINNILSSLKNALLFYILIFIYFIIAYINYVNKISFNLVL